MACWLLNSLCITGVSRMSVQAPLGSSADDPLAKPLHVQRIEAALRLDTFLGFTERILNDAEYRYHHFIRFFSTVIIWLKKLLIMVLEVYNCQFRTDAHIFSVIWALHWCSPRSIVCCVKYVHSNNTSLQQFLQQTNLKCNFQKGQIFLWYAPTPGPPPPPMLLYQRWLIISCCFTSNVQLLVLAGYPLTGISACVICMKYRIMIWTIIIISLGQILWSYITNTPRTHARTHAHTHTHTHMDTHTHTHTWTHTHSPPSPFKLSLFDGSVAPNRDKS